MSDNTASAIGLVVIGRNEGERLRRCLQSVLGEGRQVVYVDSGSTDGSVELARSLGAQVVALDMRQPFTAARARNAGWRALLLQAPQVRYVQFIDGDCEMNAGWLAAAQACLDGHPQHAVVAGRLRERHPERSIYNRLCDIEWDTPVGDTKACGGIAMVRATPLQAVGGFRDDLIAGEEPELCVRLRAAGWKIYRLDAEMALHDAAMLHWRQWWRRTMRGGFAYAQGAWLHGAAPERHWVRETMRALAWGAGVPLLALVAVVAFGAWGLAVVLIYPLQMLRLALKMRDPRRAFFLVAGKWAEAWGAIRFYWGRLLQRRQGIIEYK